MMHDWLVNEAAHIHWYVWLAALAVMSVWEGAASRYPLSTPLRRRWAGNLSLCLASMILVRLSLPVLCLEFSRIVLEREQGLFASLDMPIWVNVLTGIIVLDLNRYLLHSASHHGAWLWRLHRVHHTDQDFDFTTSVRFHPVELGLITTINLAIIAILGLHPIAVLLSETLSLAVNTFNHGNVRIPAAIDNVLRRVVVTPDMHRIHHSSRPEEFNANLGGLFSWWDRLFRTYLESPEHGYESMHIGLTAYSEPKHASLGWMLVNPLLSAEPTPRPRANISDSVQADPG